MAHGGVRYLEQGKFRSDGGTAGAWQYEAECAIWFTTSFCVPTTTGGSAFLWVGLKIYNLLAGRYNLGHLKYFAPRTLARLPTINTEGLRARRILRGHFDDRVLPTHRNRGEQGETLDNYGEATR